MSVKWWERKPSESNRSNQRGKPGENGVIEARGEEFQERSSNDI